jgi:2,5-furandicarboxylate decarboxylase 1
LLSFRQFVAQLNQQGDVLYVSRSVAPDYELAALLKQAEARRKAVMFEAVQGSEFPVLGGALSSATRFGMALEEEGADGYTLANHRKRILAAIDSPLACSAVDSAACKHTVLLADAASVDALPVPTFFAGDSGPFITAALGISRNPDNEVINVGFYRLQRLAENRLIINASPNSGLNHILGKDHAAGTKTCMAFVVGAPPALLMAAAARVPPDRSELDVAGAIAGSPLQTIAAECSALPVPAEAEFIIEVEVDYAEQADNTMGEYGNLYGTQAAPIASIKAITHREDPIFHCIMAGAGKEHNALGMHILYGVEPDLNEQLKNLVAEVASVRVNFDPPRMGNEGRIYVRLNDGCKSDLETICRQIIALNCGGYPLARVIRLIVLVDTDIDITNPIETDWACATRAVSADDYLSIDDLGEKVRLGIDARATNPTTQRLIIPGEDDYRLDDYLLVDGK